MEALRTCYHCGETCDTSDQLFLTHADKELPMCCYGCQAAAAFIFDHSLDRFYTYRQRFAPKVTTDDATTQWYDDSALTASFVSTDKNISSAKILVQGITCTACIWLIEKHLLQLNGVLQTSLNSHSHQLLLKYDHTKITLSALITSIYKLGYSAAPYKMSTLQTYYQAQNQKFLKQLIVAGLGTMQVMMFSIALYAGAFSDMIETSTTLFRWVSLLVCTPVVLYAAQPFINSAIRDIRHFELSMNVPIAVAISLAYLASMWSTFTHGAEVYFDSVCMFTFFILLGRFLEFKARFNMLESQQNMQSLLPDKVTVFKAQAWCDISISDLTIGDIVKVAQGSTIPVDGIILHGITSVDESILNGEFTPKIKTIDEHVLAGSRNVENEIHVKMTHQQNETALNYIHTLIDNAHAHKPKITQLTHTIASKFILGVLILTSCTYGYWMIHAPQDAFWIALSVLVATCPCALSLATPTALMAGMNKLQQLGFYIIHNDAIEHIAKLEHLIFDKTGTLTAGLFSLQSITVFNKHYIDNDVLSILSALEKEQHHPIALCLKKYPSHHHATDVLNHVGKGIEGNINGTHFYLGNNEFFHTHCHTTSHNVDSDNTSFTTLFLFTQENIIATLSFEDAIRLNADKLVTYLQAQNIVSHIVSGDNKGSVKKVAHSLNIQHFVANTSPDKKITYLKHTLSQSLQTAMIGDGINDAPVLAAAPFSIAMGNASALTKIQAGAILVNENLETLVQAHIHSKKTFSVVKQNIIWAVGYNVAVLPLAVSGILPPYAAAIGMSLSSLIVTLNALKLKK